MKHALYLSSGIFIKMIIDKVTAPADMPYSDWFLINKKPCFQYPSFYPLAKKKEKTRSCFYLKAQRVSQCKIPSCKIISPLLIIVLICNIIHEQANHMFFYKSIARAEINDHKFRINDLR